MKKSFVPIYVFIFLIGFISAYEYGYVKGNKAQFNKPPKTIPSPTHAFITPTVTPTTK